MELGIKFNLPDENKLVRNSKNSHRLFEYVLKKYGEKTQIQLVEEVMRSYFERQENIYDATVLGSSA